MTGTGSAAFGAWLRERIGTRTYGQVGEYVGVRASTVSRWVTGESAPEYRNRLALAAYLGVLPDEVHAFFPAGKPSPDVAVMTTPGNKTGSLSPEGDAAPQLAPLADAHFFGLVSELGTLTDEERAAVLPVLREIVGRRRRGSTHAGGGGAGATGSG